MHSFEQAAEHWRGGRRRSAEAICRQLLVENPSDARAIHLLAILMTQAGQVQLALDLANKAIALQPSSAEFQNTLGVILMRLGRSDEAEATMRQTLQLHPQFPDAHYNLGLIHQRQGRMEESVAELREAIQLQPDRAEAWVNLSVSLRSGGHIDEAIAAVERALQIKPQMTSAKNNLAGLLKDIGRMPESVGAYRALVESDPTNAAVHSNLLYSLHYVASSTPQSLFDEHRKWNDRHAAKLQSQIAGHSNDRSPNRRLRIGLVSPDFRRHPVGRFLISYFDHRDRDAVELFCYSDVSRPDKATARFKSSADAWRETAGISDAQLADLIPDDRIDVLVDVTMHMANNRMLLFARKPAPVQASYLAYCSTTGLDAIDYRITDRFLDSPGSTEKIYSENSIWLAGSYWCYPQPEDAPEVAPLPALTTKQITFACLNAFCKVSDETLTTWKRLLDRVPHSRLMIYARGELAQKRMLQAGFNRDQVAFADRQPLRDYLASHSTIDIALDPFPYTGGTTTCDALWMGVPVISLAGATAVARSGLSILSNIGLNELVAHSVDEYVEKAASLATDFDKLAALRSSMRDRMRQSPLMDGPRYARDLTEAFRSMWARYLKP